MIHAGLAVFGFVLWAYGEGRTALKHEARFLATDDSARTHLRRFWPVAELFVAFFMRRTFRMLATVAEEQREAAAPPPPWRRRPRQRA